MIPSSVFTKELYNTLPQGWIEKRLKFVSHILPSNVDKKNYEDQKTVQLCNYVDVYYNDSIDSSLNFMTSTASDQEINKFTLRTGDVIITKDSESPDDIGIPSVVRENIDDLICGYHLTVLKPRNEIYGYFLFWYIYSKLSSSFFEKRANGITRFAIGMNTISSLPIIFPSLDLQIRISDFLDKETSRIDTLITKKQKQIELLNEKRQAIITQSVTKGLNENVKMKDSGVEWIGEIPEHWDIRKLRYIGTCQNGISKGGEYFGTGFPFVSYGDVYKNVILPEEVKGKVESSDSERNNCSVREGDIFFTRTSETIEEIGIVSTCLKTIPDAVFAGFLIRVRPKIGVLNNNYSKYYFRSDIHRKYFVKEMNIVTRASLGQELLKNLPVILPPLDEMRNIGKFIDEQIDINIKTINLVKKSIDLLKEYRSSLITHAVSGQIDISKYEVSK